MQFFIKNQTQLQKKLIWPQKCRMSNCSGLPLVHFYRSGGTSINSSLHISALFPNFIGYRVCWFQFQNKASFYSLFRFAFSKATSIQRK